MSWWSGRRVTVTGGRGFLGRVVVDMIAERGAAQVSTFSSRDYDLTRQGDVARMYAELRPDLVIHLAARVGGIGANRENPGRFLYENAAMGLEIIEQARHHLPVKVVQIGTVCSYPKLAPIPFREESLWDGYPEETNAPYGVAKKLLLVQAQAYRRQYGLDTIYLIPVNLYGPGDNFDLQTSHVIPALIRKLHTAKESAAPEVALWGSGAPTREFLYVDDAARGIVLAAERYDGAEPVNLGTASEISIRDLAGLVAGIVGYEGTIVWDTSLPDGQPRRKLDVSRARDLFGFEAEVGFEDGLRRTYSWYLENLAALASP